MNSPLASSPSRSSSVSDTSHDTWAFDYTAQRWVEGRAGLELRCTQLREELAVLNGPRGFEYFNATRTKTGSACWFDAMLECTRLLHECERLLAEGL